MTETVANVATASSKGQRAPTLYLIAGYKMVKALLLLGLGAWLFALAGKNLGDMYDNFLRWVHVDPSYRFFAAIGDRLDEVTTGNVKAVASGTMIYGAFLFVSGLGLALRASWAIWVTIGESAFFLPIEIFELVRRRPVGSDLPHHQMLAHPKLGLLIVFVLNLIVVAYLYINRHRLLRSHGTHPPVK
jgi:uncharacterized membrane protein (DUF2068 family)